MQSFTTAQCNALPIYTGSNESAVIGLTDSRGGTTRTYQVAKLADNKCWMLNNLKLGSTTAVTNLTSSDTNLTTKTSFELPQVLTTGSTATSGTGNGIDTPYVYGPVPGDTGVGATNYGYLYNWSAATAGATRTTNAAGSGDSQNSICPAGWQLPSSGFTSSNLSRLDVFLGGTGGYQAGSPSIPHWQNTGPVKGVVAGVWWGAFIERGDYGYMWSRSAHIGNAGYALNARFNSGYVNPGYGIGRGYGLAVRCLLN